MRQNWKRQIDLETLEVRYQLSVTPVDTFEAIGNFLSEYEAFRDVNCGKMLATQALDEGQVDSRLCQSTTEPVVFGDSNRDLRFDQLDIVFVLQASKYLTDEFATFEQGDWNGDGVFDQSDIIDVLIADTYEANSMAALRWRDGLNQTFEEGEVPLSYRLYLAPGHDDPNVKRPLILSLHNGSSSGADNSSHVTQRRFIDLLARTQTEDFASFLVAPQISVDQAFDDGWENSETLDSVLALVDEAISTYNVDPQRIYVVGKSMGGWGTYAAIRERPRLLRRSRTHSEYGIAVGIYCGYRRRSH